MNVVLCAIGKGVCLLYADLPIAGAVDHAQVNNA